MLSPSAPDRSGFSFSPLLFIGLIFVGVLLIEGLLLARFWLQFAAADASEGLRGFVLEVTRPMVAPFSDAQASARGSVGFFEQSTLVAAAAYLVGGVFLAVSTVGVSGLVRGGQRLSTHRRRSRLQLLDHSLGQQSTARLLGTASVSLNPTQAARAMRMLHLDQTGADIYVIPVAGGSIVAAFASTDVPPSHIPLGRLLSRRRETRTILRAFRAVEARFRYQPVYTS